ncbi:Tm-1-like ATP-binding domain-containing protein [Gymnodinialimonas sp. 2305UL16-5]|uniref:Tm-1-like ATP-binding domain-containing protein n=1 Tax=Gymnodinialimonas mytili TaxID=3126503 RepID=UPI00309CF2EC
MRVLLIGTFETKGEELRYLAQAMERHGLAIEMVDVSLGAGGTVLSGAQKLARMAERAETAARNMAERCEDCGVAVGLGGGTGGEIVLQALKGLPAVFPKFLVTTMAFDPREAVADTAITLIPTLCDIEGLNASLRQVFENAAGMVAGLYKSHIVARSDKLSVAITTLGATGPAGSGVVRALADHGCEATVFHANGYGGAAFARFVAEARVDAVVDLNVHELGRQRLAGAHVPMPTRFSCARDVPRVVLPGGLNFIGLGRIETVEPSHLARPHYRHSRLFTHVKLTADEMAGQAAWLADELNQSTAPCHVILPMGGFSHEDRAGGAIEDPELREIAAEILTRVARAYSVEPLPDHINAPPVSQAVAARLMAALHQKESA